MYLSSVFIKDNRPALLLMTSVPLCVFPCSPSFVFFLIALAAQPEDGLFAPDSRWAKAVLQAVASAAVAAAVAAAAVALAVEVSAVTPEIDVARLAVEVAAADTEVAAAALAEKIVVRLTVQAAAAATHGASMRGRKRYSQGQWGYQRQPMEK